MGAFFFAYNLVFGMVEVFGVLVLFILGRCLVDKRAVSRRWYKPMLLTTAVGLPKDSANWLYEVKWNGWRMLAYYADGVVTLRSRTGRDCTQEFPAITAALPKTLSSKKYRQCVPDGEVVAVDKKSKKWLPPGSLRSRDSHVEKAYIVFDILELNNEVLIRSPLIQRRAKLEPMWRLGSIIQVSDTYENGLALLKGVYARGLEGIVMKRVDSLYRPGVRSDSWCKLKIETLQKVSGTR